MSAVAPDAEDDGLIHPTPLPRARFVYCAREAAPAPDTGDTMNGFSIVRNNNHNGPSPDGAVGVCV